MRKLVVAIGVAGVLLGGCSGGGDDGRIAFDVSFQNLPALPPHGGTYEGWAVVGGLPFSTGKFRVDDRFVPPRIYDPTGFREYGTTQSATFGPAVTQLGELFPFILNATSWFVTVEPEADFDLLPSGNVVLAGDIVVDTAVLQPTGFTSGALTSAAGSALLVTPTDLTDVDANGIWFVLDAAGTPALSMPELTGAWIWEGWVSDGTALYSTGKFGDVDLPDLDASASPTRGNQSVGLAAPGQDFRNQATVGVADILDLDSGDWQVFVTIEPEQDNSADPFPLMLFLTDIPTDAVTPEKVSVRNVPLDPASEPLPGYAVSISQTTFTLNALGGSQGLGSLQGDRNGHYELWAVMAGVPQSVVRFRVESGTNLVTELDTNAALGSSAAILLDTFNVPGLPDLTAAEEVWVTLELQGDPLPGPADATVLAGSVDAGLGSIDVAGLRGQGGRGIADFRFVEGSFALRTPTDNNEVNPANDHQGLWFTWFDNPFIRTLLVPPLLPDVPWVYEAWVTNTVTLERWSLGRFRNPFNADFDAGTWPGRGLERAGSPAPGQDFVNAAPGTAIPVLDLNAGYTVMVSLEPFPDSALEPYLMVLSGSIPAVGTVVPPMTNLISTNPGSLPSGVLTFKR